MNHHVLILLQDANLRGAITKHAGSDFLHCLPVIPVATATGSRPTVRRAMITQGVFMLRNNTRQPSIQAFQDRRNLRSQALIRIRCLCRVTELLTLRPSCIMERQWAIQQFRHRSTNTARLRKLSHWTH